MPKCRNIRTVNKYKLDSNPEVRFTKKQIVNHIINVKIIIVLIDCISTTIINIKDIFVIQCKFILIMQDIDIPKPAQAKIIETTSSATRNAPPNV